MTQRIRLAGTSLVEVLVVIVVFAIGILAIVQIFPGGFKVLSTTRNNLVATQLARAESERLKEHSDQLPEQILPVNARFVGTKVLIEAAPDRRTSDLGPVSSIDGFAQNGNMLEGGNTIDRWPYVSGANTMRRVIGEGKRVPSPTVAGGYFGGVLSLQFAPIVASATYNPFLVVYGADLTQRTGVPDLSVSPVRSFEYYVDKANSSAPTIYFAADPDVSANGSDRGYRLAVDAYITDSGGGNMRRVQIETAQITVLKNATGVYGLALPAGDGTNPDPLGLGSNKLVSIELNSVRVARMYKQIPLASAFSDGTSIAHTDPYEFKILSPDLGVLLFNPIGYNVTEPREGGGSAPMVAKVDYDVLDWRVIREEFRVPDATPLQVRLALGNLKVGGQTDVDGTPFAGLGFKVPDGAGGSVFAQDFVLMDPATGGVYLYDQTNPADPTPPAGPQNDSPVDPTKSSYTVNKSIGIVRFNDYDRDSTNGLQLRLLMPGAASPVTVNADGRTVRALYMAHGEWSVQAMKASEQYFSTFARPLTAQFYAGGAGAFFGQGTPAGENVAASATRIYFPLSDIGRRVSIDEVWYRRSGDPQRRLMESQTFVIQGPNATDPFDAFIDIRAVDSNAANLDFSAGYAARGVKGSSIAVRVLWNPAILKLTPNSAENFINLEKWGQNWRRTVTETFLQRGEN